MSVNLKYPAIAVIGLPRSGTSILWDLLRCAPQFKKCYMEPLHPEMLDEIVSKPWYLDLKEVWSELIPFYYQVVHETPFYLSTNDEALELYKYLKPILQEGTLTKFIRMSFRFKWLLKNYPSLKVIYILRDPRAICYSTMLYSKDIANSTADDFDHFSHAGYMSQFRALRGRWGDSVDDSEPMYVKVFYVLGKAFEELYSIEKHSRIHILYYEDLVTQTEEELERIFLFFNHRVPSKVIDRISVAGNFEDAHWNLPLYSDSKDRFREVDDNVWLTGAARAGVAELFNKFGYFL